MVRMLIRVSDRIFIVERTGAFLDLGSCIFKIKCIFALFCSEPLSGGKD